MNVYATRMGVVDHSGIVEVIAAAVILATVRTVGCAITSNNPTYPDC